MGRVDGAELDTKGVRVRVDANGGGYKSESTWVTRKKTTEVTSSYQHSPMNLFFGNGCWKSSLHVVKFGFVYASMCLVRQTGKVSYPPDTIE